MPGVERTSSGIACAIDVAEIVAEQLGLPRPKLPFEHSLTPEEMGAEVAKLPGLKRFRDLGLHKTLWAHQATGGVFMARRTASINADACRGGKTGTAIAAGVLADVRKTVVVSPAIAKYVWAEEIDRMLHEPSLILEGRARSLAYEYCCVCHGKNGGDCRWCQRSRDSKSTGFRRIEGHAEVLRAIDDAKHVLTNYDILVGQTETDARGRTRPHPDLVGWVPDLKHAGFDRAIADEAHYLRGCDVARDRIGMTRRERFVELTEWIKVVQALTATPIYGFIRDLWGLLDAISKGAFTSYGGRQSRKPYKWQDYFCLPYDSRWGRNADGCSQEAKRELPRRLATIMIRRSRSEIFQNLPEKVRQVIRLDPGSPPAEYADLIQGVRDTAELDPNVIGSPKKSRLARLLAQSLGAKIGPLRENVLGEVLEGNKVVIFTFLRASAEAISRVFTMSFEDQGIRTRMRASGARVWLVRGDMHPTKRYLAAREFREHAGVGVFVATLDAVQVAVSLRGASSVHRAELHWNPAALLQAEDRPNEEGRTRGLAVLDYVVRGSIDERMASAVLPKAINLDRIVKERDAQSMLSAFEGTERGRTDDQILDDMLKGVDLSLSAFNEDD